MFCRKCGTETSDDSQFCRKCGLGLAVSVTSGGAGAAVAPARIAEAPKKHTVRTPFIIAGVLLLAFAIFGISARYNRSANPANTIDRPFRQQHITTLKNPALRINALNFDYFKLDVPLGATNVRLQGSFTASGGMSNDVEVFLLPESDFVNWQNGHVANSLYNSGRVTVGHINVTLPTEAGTYYLVFSNKSSLLTQRSVLVDAALAYYQ